MFDTDTFLITLYVAVDDFCATHLAPEPEHFGPDASLSRSEVVTLSIFGQQTLFSSERAFYRFAERHLRGFFPRLPHRSQFSRLQMRYQRATTQFALDLARRLSSPEALGTPAYEILDRCGVATRWCGRRGAGWMPDCTDKGLCSRLGWFEGFHLLTCVTAAGVISGWGFGPASAKDQPLADDLLLARATGDPRLPSAGVSLSDADYVTDKGFAGARWHQRWRELFHVHCFVCPPPHHRTDPEKYSRWPRAWYRICASWRQVIESVHDKLLNFCRLGRERPHDLSGFSARLSAKVALHNFCMLLNWLHGREPLAFADLIHW